ncbi:MAG: hypothetical protein JXR94_15115 [Candidatus Hydrogenedentes bacterium]|nr:hypothetical protein [Candidatus Hydrogenedentota bacterium]
MEVLEYLERKIKELEIDRVQTLADLDLVKEKIEKADAQRGTQPGTPNYHKWSEILRGLESELDKSRVHLTAVEADLELKRHKLEDYRQKAAEAEAYRAALPQRILEMSIEEVGQLTAEEIAQLQEYELRQAALAEAESAAMAEAQADQPESAPAPKAPAQAAPPPPPPTPPTPPAAATDRRLPPALKKIAEGDTGNVTLDEFQLLTEVYVSLIELPALDQKTERLLDIIEKALLQINTAFGSLRESWERIAANAGD